MARKRLSDLLREEVKKPRESADQTEPDPTSQEKSSNQAARKGQKSGVGMQKSRTQPQKTSNQPLQEEPVVDETIEESDQSGLVGSVVADTMTESISTPDPEVVAELEATVTELRSKLKASERREDDLQKQILMLETELEEQKATIQTLQTDLGKINQLKTELEEARTVILQLTKANTPANPAPVAPSLPKQPDNEPKQPAAATLPPANSLHQAELSSIHRSELTKVLNHPVLPSPSSTGFSDEEIGWVD